jgi:hypothetical protein
VANMTFASEQGVIFGREIVDVNGDRRVRKSRRRAGSNLRQLNRALRVRENVVHKAAACTMGTLEEVMTIFAGSTPFRRTSRVGLCENLYCCC